MAAIEQLKVTAKGHVQVFDVTDTRILLEDTWNDIHPQNLAYTVARALAGAANGEIYAMSLGSGGTHLDAAGNLVYLPANTQSESANLYQETYNVKINSNLADGTETPSGNSVVAKQSQPPEITSEVTCTLFLPAHIPAGQAVNDATSTDPNAPYIFDELGLKTVEGRLLTHCIFSPIEKTANRIFEIKYSLIISVS